jgi:hypothetical protein
VIAVYEQLGGVDFYPYEDLESVDSHPYATATFDEPYIKFH